MTHRGITAGIVVPVLISVLLLVTGCGPRPPIAYQQLQIQDSELAEGYVGEVDQTFFRQHMKDEPTGAILVRGCHLKPFHADLRPGPARQRFLDKNAFLRQKGTAAQGCAEKVQRRRVYGCSNEACGHVFYRYKGQVATVRHEPWAKLPRREG